MTKSGGWRICCVLGVVFAMGNGATAQIFERVVSFSYSNGSQPWDVTLAQGKDGRLYGTTSIGGANGGAFSDGTVFNVTVGGELTSLYSFGETEGANGSNPSAGLVLSTDGNFYGTTPSGGSSYYFGTIFKITPAGVLTTLYNFCSEFDCKDGTVPSGALIQGVDGNFYGTTYSGGISGAGTVFKFNPSGSLTTLYNFCTVTNCKDGKEPNAGLVQGSDGNFYGTTSSGGANLYYGTAFRVTADGVLTTLHSFNGTDGSNPGGIIQGTDGNFYGVTEYGGDLNCGAPFFGCGTVFKMDPVGKITTLHSFDFIDGENPVGTMKQATDGNLYGTTVGGGTGYGYCDTDQQGRGTIFKIERSGTFTKLLDFCSGGNCDDGCFPQGGLMQETNGILYGTTSADTNNFGTVYSLGMGLGPFVTFVRAAGRIGETGPILGQGFTGTTSVGINGIQADFTVVSDTDIRATVPVGATTGYVTVTTPTGVLTSNVPFRVIQ